MKKKKLKKKRAGNRARLFAPLHHDEREKRRREQLTPQLLIAALTNNQVTGQRIRLAQSRLSHSQLKLQARGRSVIVPNKKKSTPSKNGGFLRAAIAAKSCCQPSFFLSTRPDPVFLTIELTAGTISEPSTSVLVVCLHHRATPAADSKLLFLGASILQLHAWTAAGAAAAAAAAAPPSA